MTYGPRHTIEDLYGQELQVDVEMGDEVAVCLGLTEQLVCAPPDPLPRRTVVRYSSLSPAQARELGEQLIEAARGAEQYGE